MAHCDTREGEWRGNWRMEWVASTLHTTSEHGVSNIITADTHTSAASSRLNWRPRRFKWKRPFRPKDEIWFLRVCHHVSNAVYLLVTNPWLYNKRRMFIYVSHIRCFIKLRTHLSTGLSRTCKQMFNPPPPLPMSSNFPTTISATSVRPQRSAFKILQS